MILLTYHIQLSFYIYTYSDTSVRVDTYKCQSIYIIQTIYIDTSVCGRSDPEGYVLQQGFGSCPAGAISSQHRGTSTMSLGWPLTSLPVRTSPQFRKKQESVK